MSAAQEVIITGGSGFVGSNLRPYLESKGYLVTAISLRDPGGIERIRGKASAIIHLAGLAHDLRNALCPEDYYRINTELTGRVFEAFVSSDIQRFIYFSSVKAVADSLGNEVLNEERTPAPGTPYGKSKLEAERLLLSRNTGDRPMYIVRPAMIHGPGNKGNLNLLYRLVASGLPYPLGAFENLRSFLSVENLNFIIGEFCAGQVPQGVYNLADSECLSTLEVVEIIRKVIGNRSPIWRIHPGLIRLIAKLGGKLRLPFNEEKLYKLTESYRVSNRKVVHSLGRELPVDARDGIARTIQSFSRR